MCVHYYIICAAVLPEKALSIRASAEKHFYEDTHIYSSIVA